MQRIKYYDTLRFLAIFGVIALHVFQTWPNATVMNIRIDTFSEIFKFAVPVFLMISGALLLNRDITLDDFFKRRFARLTYPFILYLILYAAVLFILMSYVAGFGALSKWQGELCSTCELFTSKEYSFMPVGRLVTKGGMKAVREYYKALGEDFVRALDDMLVLDAVICNVDRHFGNFGFLVDNRTNKIAAPAPLFDHGNSLFNLAGRDDLASDKALSEYADTLVPCVYDDFIGTAKNVMTNTHRDELRRLLDFRFKRHSRYNLGSKRLKLIEEQIHKRAKELLK